MKRDKEEQRVRNLDLADRMIQLLSRTESNPAALNAFKRLRKLYEPKEASK